jgi:flagellar M-ring protein FliF
MKQLEQIVKQAVGIDANRSDEVSIINMSFEGANSLNTDLDDTSSANGIDKYMNLVVIVAAILAAMFVLKTLLKRLKNEKIVISTMNLAAAEGPFLDKRFEPSALPQPEEKKMIQQPKKKKQPLEIGDITDEISDEALTKQVRQEKLINYVAKNPVEAARLINLWLREDEY